MLRRRRTLYEPEVRYYIRQLLQAIDYLYKMERVLHRDVKLGNMLISHSDSDGIQVKLADFGLATEVDWRGLPGGM